MEEDELKEDELSQQQQQQQQRRALPPPLVALTAVEDTSTMLWTEDIHIPFNAAHVYSECARIWNPIHTDKKVARQAGLPDILLHGTASLALSVSAILRHFQHFNVDGAPVDVGGESEETAASATAARRRCSRCCWQLTAGCHRHATPLHSCCAASFPDPRAFALVLAVRVFPSPLCRTGGRRRRG